MALTKRQRKERLGWGAQKQIARELDLSESTVSQVVNGKTQSLNKQTAQRVRAAIAEKIGAAVEEVFGTAA